MPGLAESWKRIDERTVEFTLRKGVKFHNGDEMTADDVVFTFSRERMFGPDYDISSNKTLFTSVLIRDSGRGQEAAARGAGRRQAPAARRSRRSRRSTSTRCASPTACPTSRSKAASAASGSDIICRRAFMEAKSWMEWSRKPVATGPYKVREFVPDESPDARCA